MRPVCVAYAGHASLSMQGALVVHDSHAKYTKGLIHDRHHLNRKHNPRSLTHLVIQTVLELATVPLKLKI